ncbi:hypothetical protein QVD17_23484 [Tagetes erecta]|uniref:HMA domain-containing protein n=1 Tax=Tagetes erecta TaxID=13708 RepID=A0AAD8KH56_TARER|nr:hypothetical protein QVD17_23484 [Tagetes erecta]
MTIILRITKFHNCDGCARKVRIALRRIGVELVKLDRETGDVTIATAEPPEEIRQALEHQLKKPVVNMSKDLVPTNQNLNTIMSHQTPTNQVLDLQRLGETVLRLAQELDGVEITNSNKVTINFIRRQTPIVVRSEPRANINVRIRDADAEHAPQRPPPRSPPWSATEPSAPLVSTTEETAAYGYPVSDYYRVSTHHNHDNPSGCCGII